MTTAAVNILETDANANAVPVVIAFPALTSALPEAPAQERPSSQTMATDNPGTPFFLRHVSIAFWRRATGTPASGSSGGDTGGTWIVAAGSGVAVGSAAPPDPGVAEGSPDGARLCGAAGVPRVTAAVPLAIATLSGPGAEPPANPASTTMTATSATTASRYAGRRAQGAGSAATVTAARPWSGGRTDAGTSRRRTCGARGSRSRLLGGFGMMVRR